MALTTDRFFYDALRANSGIMLNTDGRIFNPARPEIDEEEDAIPYIIIQHTGLQQNSGSKDAEEEDTDTITITAVAETREGLGNLAQLIRDVMREAFDAFSDDDETQYGFGIEDYGFSAGPVQYDSVKPCHFQDLVWSCETINVLQ